MNAEAGGGSGAYLRTQERRTRMCGRRTGTSGWSEGQY
ncbi:hypothetical protein STRTUCAR8_09341 [Streptomyces turgidiscabies Car8]|uniref:Uncharacterized protein n=1 Tax=Streptomyces turgidiscabies (strain Car8) TaxID=698760 RepID=L7FA23_STRT8|nr:hypothetical protein STRTUCAR8_09341 [Streptomyces turgidiscabies Car8]